MVIMNALEWPMFSYYGIYYDFFFKSHAANREGSFNYYFILYKSILNHKTYAQMY